MACGLSRSYHEQPIRTILTLAIAPMIGLGICRFAYALVLPDMRESLGWSYSLAGSMNTLNACGYLVGALAANALIRRYDMLSAIRIGAIVCVLSLIVSAASSSSLIFGAARLLSGAAAALTFVAGGALAANVAQAQARNQAFYLSLFYVGPAVGILLSGSLVPFLLEWLGHGSWWMVWAVLGVLSTLVACVLGTLRVEDPDVEHTAHATEPSILPILSYLIGYFLFGAGYIAYMTFMIAFVRDSGGGALAQSVFWICLGVGAFAQPWTWRRPLAAIRGGGITALLTLITAGGAIMPFLERSPTLLVASAFVFGNAFFAVVSSTVAFARCNYPHGAWTRVIAAMTVSFSIGQSLGPIAIGAITDSLGSLSSALAVSAAILVLSACAFVCQRRLQPRTLVPDVRFHTPPAR